MHLRHIKWLIEKSGFAESEGGITGIKGSKLPDALTIFDSIEPALTAIEEHTFHYLCYKSEKHKVFVRTRPITYPNLIVLSLL